ncbi:MAG: PLP-dependent aminotransferase family protein [Thermoleophilaceae bacterium]|nr:PLP-dependent aminotransferase family protein [Thermoleophilaceae bacterium]
MTIDDRKRGPVPPRSTSRDLERYAGLFAARTRVMNSSAMRDMMAITARPEVISLAGGLPDTSSFPPATFAAVTARIAHESSAKALQYGPTEGLDETIDCIVEVMAEEGIKADPGDVMVTTGGQQALDLMAKILIDPGDVIVAEAPSYPGALNAFSAYQADVVQVETDDDGLRIDLLEELLDRLEGEGRRPKFIYTVPTFQNPAGVTMSVPRRRRLVDVAREREMLVVEDNPYALLRYEGEPLPSLLELDGGEYVMYIGTFSKILSPGIRLGWIVAPPPVLEKVNLGKQAADLCTSTLSQLMVQAYFEESRWQDYVASLTDIYRDRRDAMLGALEEFFPPEAEWTHPGGGLFIWATLPDFVDTTALLARALRENVAFVPGEGAFLDGRGHNAMRLNFSASREDEIREGIRRIGEVVKEQVALYGTLTGRPAPKKEPAAPEEEGGRVLRLPQRAQRRDRAEES